MSTKIIIDSSSDISAAEADILGITMVPMVISFDGRNYFDGVDLLPEQFYEKLIESDALPKTGQVTPYRFSQALEPLLAAGHDVVIITISSKLSGTYSAALQSAKEWGDRVCVVDSQSACIGERLLCQYALERLSRTPELTAHTLADELERAKSKLCVMAMLNTLEYLKKGGRISGVVAFAGELIGLKPVIAIAEGEIVLVGKARGSKNGSNLLTELIHQQGGIDFSMPYGVVRSGLDDSLLQKYLRDHAFLWQSETEHVPAYLLGGTIGTHIGPGAIGVAFFAK